MFVANDVVYLVRRIRILFMKQTILAPICRTFRDESP
jgi:hypothetical protein